MLKHQGHDHEALAKQVCTNMLVPRRSGERFISSGLNCFDSTWLDNVKSPLDDVGSPSWWGFTPTVEAFYSAAKLVKP
jgi:hypothetical protein